MSESVFMANIILCLLGQRVDFSFPAQYSSVCVSQSLTHALSLLVSQYVCLDI